MTTVRTLMEVVRLSTGYLESHGSSSPRLDAELLAATAFSVPVTAFGTGGLTKRACNAAVT
ncbi:MAG: hypothetical protein NVS3B18_09470 [Candidatus Dormibacteria bacterium]